MPLRAPYLRTRTARLAALAVCAALLAGCQGVTGIQPSAQVRVIVASPDAPPLDIAQNSATGPATLYNLGFGTVTSYIPVNPGASTHAALVAGTQQQLAQTRASYAAGGQYTLLAGNIAANLQLAVLKDQAFPAPSGQIALRFLGQATRSGPVDLYLVPAGAPLAGLGPVATNVAFGTNTGYINAPAGTYSLVALPAGNNPAAATPVYTSSQASYPATAVRTILLLDQQPSGLQTIAAADFDPAG